MKNVVTFLVVVSLLFACSEDKFVGSGDSISEFRQVDYFNEVSSEGTFEVSITTGNEQLVEIIADNNIMHRVRTNVINGILKLHLANGSYNNVSLEAHITVLDLKGIENSGAGDMYVTNNFDVETFKVFNSGSANMYLEGSTDNLGIENEGSGSVLAEDMVSKSANIKNIGSGEIEVTCESNLDVSIEGSGNVYYHGHPTINVQVEGSGNLINDN